MYEYKKQDKKKNQIAFGKDTDLIQCCKHDKSCPYKDPCPIHGENRQPPRRRRRALQSEGNSESEDPLILYRALRPDESPLEEGICARKDADSSISISQHVTSGSRAKRKSSKISATHSKKVAGAWAGDGQKVAKFRVPPSVEAYDFTQDPPPVPLGRTALNAARASQEVVIEGTIPREDILEISTVNIVEPETYQRVNIGDEYNGGMVVSKYRTRQRSGDPVKNCILTV